MRMIVNIHWGSGFVVSLQYGLRKVCRDEPRVNCRGYGGAYSGDFGTRHM